MRRPADLRSWGALAACLAAVAALSIVGGRVAEATATREVSVAVGDTARLREYAVRVDRVERATTVVVATPTAGAGADAGSSSGTPATSGTGRTLTAGGIFVVVSWTASGASDPVAPLDARLVTGDGRSYAPRVGTGGVGPRLVQPGFDLHWVSVYDVPAAALDALEDADGVDLVVTPTPWRTPLYDTTLRIPLGVVPLSTRGPVTVPADRSTVHP